MGRLRARDLSSMPKLFNENRASSLRAQTETLCRSLLLLLTPALVAACSLVSGLDDFSLTSEADGSTTSSGEESPPPGCIPSMNQQPVGNACGVFVSAAATAGGDGTKEKPFQSFAEAITALDMAGDKRIYACAEVFTEEVDLPGGIDIYGGIDCNDSWRYVGDSKKTELTAEPDKIPLTMFGGSGTSRIEDLHVRAAAALLEGGSSIAIVADGVEVEFARSTLEAQDAMDGAAGANYTMSAKTGALGSPGSNACSAGSVPGGGETVNDCGGDVLSVGGSGGTGNVASGGTGSPGLTGPANGGAGEGNAACNSGGDGAVGTTGSTGAGATGLGTITRGGHTGATGSNGMPGTPGQGGGGGGGSKGGTGSNKCPVSNSAGGASGGSGGSGGCGGAGGRGGNAGGSSIALISLNATLTFDSVTLKTGRGGAGGAGGPGQDGGSGGQGGPGGNNAGHGGLNAGCAGGDGGKGGKGGQGGGGSGGHSLGIAHKGTAPSTDGATIQTGEAGLGGVGANPGGKGADGVKGNTHQFP